MKAAGHFPWPELEREVYFHRKGNGFVKLQRDITYSGSTRTSPSASSRPDKRCQRGLRGKGSGPG